MDKPVAVKYEIPIEEGVGSSSNPIIPSEQQQHEASTPIPEVTQSMAADISPEATISGNNGMNASHDQTILSNIIGAADDDGIYDEDDEIIREIDVYISPELANTMHLIQFPLQPASHSVINIPKSASEKQRKQQQSVLRSQQPPQPISARIKPENAILELGYKVPSSSFSSQRQIPAPLSLSERTFASNNIPILTHMAMGLFDNTNSKLDLIPLHRIMQMRPSFAHVDALFQNEDDDTEALEKAKKTKEEEAKKLSQPILFKKSESERAAMQRRSSYAFKKANVEAEEWIDLDVHGVGSLARKETIKRAHCPREKRDTNLEFLKSGKIGGNAGYVRSLNYLPSTVIEDAVEDFIIDEHEIVVDGGGELEWKKDLTTRVAALLQERGGMPVPYVVLRSRFQPSIPDVELIDAISASAVLVRGNFMLKSSLMALSNVHVENARDVILILMIKYGIVQRAKLFKAFQRAEDDASVMITLNVINSLLELMGKKTRNGIEMKLDDDLTFEIQFTQTAETHALYWEQRELTLRKYVRLYEREDDMVDTTELNEVLFGKS